jgi:hypothetical protein
MKENMLHGLFRKRTPFFFCMALLAFLLLPETANADGPDVYLSMKQLPREVKPFVSEGTQPLSLTGADLDGDGLQDFILVLERQKARSTDPDIELGQRPLLILIRQTDGSLKLVKRNDDIIRCSTCGGIMGDPFEGVSAEPKTFTVSHSGGSAWRWNDSYTFNYSRRDRTWQLVRVEEGSFHTSDPDKAKTDVFTPPKHYGKIDIADFHPKRWKGTGYGKLQPPNKVR